MPNRTTFKTITAPAILVTPAMTVAIRTASNRHHQCDPPAPGPRADGVPGRPRTRLPDATRSAMASCGGCWRGCGESTSGRRLTPRSASAYSNTGVWTARCRRALARIFLGNAPAAGGCGRARYVTAGAQSPNTIWNWRSAAGFDRVPDLSFNIGTSGSHHPHQGTQAESNTSVNVASAAWTTGLLRVPDRSRSQLMENQKPAGISRTSPQRLLKRPRRIARSPRSPAPHEKDPDSPHRQVG